MDGATFDLCVNVRLLLFVGELRRVAMLAVLATRDVTFLCRSWRALESVVSAIGLGMVLIGCLSRAVWVVMPRESE